MSGTWSQVKELIRITGRWCSFGSTRAWISTLPAGKDLYEYLRSFSRNVVNNRTAATRRPDGS